MSKYYNYTFPSNLDKTNSACILLIGRKWETKYRKDLTAQFIADNNYISITLPMPTGGLSDSTSFNWESTESALLNFSSENVAKRFLKGLTEKIKNTFGIMAAQQYETGRTINDFAAMMFGGQDFRQTEFEFELIPNNIQDSKIIHDIIKALKKGSLPGGEREVITKYPYFWTIQAINPNGEKYFQMKKCVINNLSINKFQENNTIHIDGEPIQTNISISFTELEKEWADQYK